jgi:hypothetical protein
MEIGGVGLTNYKNVVLFAVFLLSSIGIYGIFTYSKSQNSQDIIWIKDFQQIDEYPLFVANYVGDYRFNEYLETGRRPRLGSIGCTCFAADLFVGRNFDFPSNPALLLFTSPDDGYKSVSMVDLGYFGYSMSNPPDDSSGLEETPYMPFDGMNEKGLVVTMAAVPYADAPSDNMKSVGEIAAIRLLLDYAANVDEAVELLSGYNVIMADPPIHYLVADARGESVIIEFVGNEMNTFMSKDYGIITNFIISGVDLPSESPCYRYDVVYSGLMDNDVMSKDIVFSLLEDSSQSSTIWSCVYNMEDLYVHIVMGRNYGTEYLFHLEP